MGMLTVQHFNMLPNLHFVEIIWSCRRCLLYDRLYMQSHAELVIFYERHPEYKCHREFIGSH